MYRVTDVFSYGKPGDLSFEDGSREGQHITWSYTDCSSKALPVVTGASNNLPASVTNRSPYIISPATPLAEEDAFTNSDSAAITTVVSSRYFLLPDEANLVGRNPDAQMGLMQLNIGAPPARRALLPVQARA